MTDEQTSTYAGPQRVFSGIQPTGNLHLGNYLGALKKFATLQDAGWDCVYCVVDLHAITAPHDAKRLPQETVEAAAIYLAAGIDPTKSRIFVQVRGRAGARALRRALRHVTTVHRAHARAESCHCARRARVASQLRDAHQLARAHDTV